MSKRVVDAQAEPEQRGQVEHEDAHRRQRCQDEDRGQRDDDGRATDDERHAGRDDRPKTSSSASAASGSEMSSLRWRSRSETAWMSP